MSNFQKKLLEWPLSVFPIGLERNLPQLVDTSLPTGRLYHAGHPAQAPHRPIPLSRHTYVRYRYDVHAVRLQPTVEGRRVADGIGRRIPPSRVRLKKVRASRLQSANTGRSV